MAFNVIEEFGEVSTFKDDESVVVQRVEVSGRSGTYTKVELRKYVKTDRYDGPTKEAFGFDSAVELAGLIAALQAALNDFESTTTPQAQPAPAPRPRVRKAAAVKPGARKAAAGRR